MALIKCEDCNKEISDKAGNCVHCGCPISKKINKKEQISQKHENFIKVASSKMKQYTKRQCLIISIFITVIVLVIIMLIFLKDNTLFKSSYKNGDVVYFNPVINKACDNYTESNSHTGVKTGCMKWYVFNDKSDATTVNLLLDHNTVAILGWNMNALNNLDDFNTNPQIGEPMITELKALEAIWDKPVRLISADEIAQITGHPSFEASTSKNGFYFDTNSNTAPTKFNYGWLYDRTKNNCIEKGYGCLNNGVGPDTWGYWTSSPTSTPPTIWVVDSGILSGYFADGINYGGGLGYGLRPVITVSRTDLKTKEKEKEKYKGKNNEKVPLTHKTTTINLNEKLKELKYGLRSTKLDTDKYYFTDEYIISTAIQHLYSSSDYKESSTEFYNEEYTIPLQDFLDYVKSKYNYIPNYETFKQENWITKILYDNENQEFKYYTAAIGFGDIKLLDSIDLNIVNYEEDKNFYYINIKVLFNDQSGGGEYSFCHYDKKVPYTVTIFDNLDDKKVYDNNVDIDCEIMIKWNDGSANYAVDNYDTDYNTWHTNAINHIKTITKYNDIIKNAPTYSIAFTKDKLLFDHIKKK